MIPVLAIIGRPNVGKSTLFNRLTKTRNALISDYAGTTRDRQFGDVKLLNRHFIVVDTGGITSEKDDIDQLITEQAQQAVQDANKIMFLVDGRSGLTAEDHQIADFLRRSGKDILLVTNKTEGFDKVKALTESYELGLGEPLAISSAHGHGIDELVTTLFPEENMIEEEEEEKDNRIKIAIVGRPNVGKSTLTNRMLGEVRVIVCDLPGTTRDSIFIPLERHGKEYTLIDTAGVRKRKKVKYVPEKFSIIKTLQAIEASNVVVYVVDANIGISEQDLRLIGFVLECGKGIVIVVNKWDGLDEDTRQYARDTLDRKLDFVRFARNHYISALHGSGVGNIFDSVLEAYESATMQMTTSKLTKLLEEAVIRHQPPLIRGRRVKLRYAHPGGNNPPRIIIHGNQVDALPESYKRYLQSYYQKKLNMHGTPVHVQFKVNENPYD